MIPSSGGAHRVWSSWAPLAMAEPEFRDFACDVVLVHLFRGAVLLGSRLPHTHRPCAMVHRKLQIDRKSVV